MKPSILHLTDQELQKLACLEFSQSYAASIRIKADDHRIYTFAASQYIDGVIEANPGEGSLPPERLVLRFTTGEVTALGSGLDRIEDRLAEGHLRGLKTVEPRYASAIKSGPIIVSLTVSRKNEA